MPYLWWGGSGDDPPSGFPSAPTVGLLEPILDPSPPSPGWPYSGIRILGDGTISGIFRASAVGVRVHPIYVVTFAVLLNDVVVASDTITIPADHPTAGWSDSLTVPFTNIAVSDGDELRGHVSSSPTEFPFFRSPAGTGGVSNRLEITSASLS